MVGLTQSFSFARRWSEGEEERVKFIIKVCRSLLSKKGHAQGKADRRKWSGSSFGFGVPLPEGELEGQGFLQSPEELLRPQGVTTHHRKQRAEGRERPGAEAMVCVAAQVVKMMAGAVREERVTVINHYRMSGTGAEDNNEEE